MGINGVASRSATRSEANCNESVELAVAALSSNTGSGDLLRLAVVA